MSKSPVSSFVKGEFNGDLRRKRKMYNILNSKRGFVLLLITVFAAVSFSVSPLPVSERMVIVMKTEEVPSGIL